MTGCFLLRVYPGGYCAAAAVVVVVVTRSDIKMLK